MTTFFRIKTLGIALLLIAVCFSSAFSQTETKESTPEERAQQWTTWMKEQLALAPDQEAKVHAINLKYASQNEDLKASTASRRDKFRQLKSRDNDKDAELKEILTSDQFHQYQQKKKDFQRQMMSKLR